MRFGSNPALSADTGRTERRPDLSLISLVPDPELKAEDSAKLAYAVALLWISNELEAVALL